MTIDFRANQTKINHAIVTYHGVTKSDLAKFAGKPADFLAVWDKACKNAAPAIAKQPHFAVAIAAEELAKLLKA